MAYETRLRCPVQRTVALIADKYKVLVLDELLEGTKRFSDLQRALDGVTPKVLTRQLRDLERDNLVLRTAYPEVPPRVEYELTALGRSIEPVLRELFIWATANAPKLGGRRTVAAPVE